MALEDLHPLKKYLSDKNITVTLFSEISGVSVHTLHKVLRDEKVKPSVAKKIWRATKREVSMESMSK